jgi:hypothetical protein
MRFHDSRNIALECIASRYAMTESLVLHSDQTPWLVELTFRSHVHSAETVLHPISIMVLIRSSKIQKEIMITSILLLHSFRNDRPNHVDFEFQSWK